MDWFGKDSLDLLQKWVDYTPTCLVVLSPEGAILWYNAAFARWSEYTYGELRGRHIKEISVDGVDFAADQAAFQDVIEGRQRSYTCRRQLRQKHGSAKWGSWTMIRYPDTGDFERGLCSWTPWVDEASDSLEHTLEKLQEFTESMAMLTLEYESLRKQLLADAETTKFQRFVMLGIDLGVQYPKTALMILVVILSMLGFTSLSAFIREVGQLNTYLNSEPAAAPTEVPPEGATEMAFASPINWNTEHTTPAGHTISTEKLLNGNLRIHFIEGESDARSRTLRQHYRPDGSYSSADRRSGGGTESSAEHHRWFDVSTRWIDYLTCPVSAEQSKPTVDRF